MKFTTHPHRSDLLELEELDIELLKQGCTLSDGALNVKLNIDAVYELRVIEHSMSTPLNRFSPHIALPTDVEPANIRLVFDSVTHKLKRAEVL